MREGGRQRGLAAAVLDAEERRQGIEGTRDRVDRGLAREMRTRPCGRPGSNGPAGSDGVGGASTRIADVAQGDWRSHGPSRPL
jgi:hypothetical protein